MSNQRIPKKVHEARERWAQLNVLSLRIFEAKGAVTACIKQAERNDLPPGDLEGILRMLTEEAGRVAVHKDDMTTLCEFSPDPPGLSTKT